MKKGFTLLEILIVLAVMAVLTGGIMFYFSSFRNIQTLDNAVEEIVSLINFARSKTLASENFSQYGVHFAAADATLFKGTAFSEAAPDNIKITLSSLVEISDINLTGGGADLIFEKLTGKTNNYGTIILRLKADPAKIKNINIKSTGIIDVL